MKLQELRTIIREVIAEEIANESYNKKAYAINEIKRIIAENELTEEEVEEGLKDIVKQTLGIASKEDKKKFDDEIAKLKADGQISDKAIEFVTKKAKSYSYIGKLAKDATGNWNFTGKSAAPATGMAGLQPGSSGNA